MVPKTFRVLLVEDDAPLRHLLRSTLERSGRFTIVGEAADGAAGVRAASQLRADLILLDLAMPLVGGIEALPAMRKASPTSKVVALSMLQREQWERPALAAGAVAFLDKSIPSRELIERLLTILDGDGTGSGRRGPPGPVNAHSWGELVWKTRSPTLFFPSSNGFSRAHRCADVRSPR